MTVEKRHKAMRLSTELIDQVQSIAERENRSFTNMVEVILTEYLRGRTPVQQSADFGEPTNKRKSTKFVAPSVEQVKKYCLERGNNIDPETFVYFYQTKGWKVGNTPMKDWRAAVITWERKSNGPALGDF